MSYTCSDFVDSILDALGIEVPEADKDDPERQADLALIAIDRLKAAAGGTPIGVNTVRLDTIDVSDAAAVQCFLDRQGNSEANTHGPLTMKSLAEMLMEDVALSERRPGSWEGSIMGDLLSAHGYQA